MTHWTGSTGSKAVSVTPWTGSTGSKAVSVTPWTDSTGSKAVSVTPWIYLCTLWRRWASDRKVADSAMSGG